MTGAVVIGVGNEFRRDDGAGLAVLARLRTAVPDSVRLVASDGEPGRLIEAWAGADLAIVVDAVRADPADQPAPGRTLRLAIDQVGAPAVTPASSHGLGLAEAIGLARALDLMPGQLIVHAVEGSDWDYGVGLTPAVAVGAESLAAAVLSDLGSTTRGPAT